MSLVPRISQQLWPPFCYLCPQQGCAPTCPLSPGPATCLQPYLGTGHVPTVVSPICPHCVPAPGQGVGCSHLPPAWCRDEEVSSPRCPQCVPPQLSPMHPQRVPNTPWEKLLAVTTCLLPDSGPGPTVVVPTCPWHVPCPQDEPAAMTTHELPGSAATFEVTGLAPGHTFELFIQAQRQQHLGAPGTLRVRTRTCHPLGVGTAKGRAQGMGTWGWRRVWARGQGWGWHGHGSGDRGGDDMDMGTAGTAWGQGWHGHVDGDDMDMGTAWAQW